jgi:type III pantothenate kinase
MLLALDAGNSNIVMALFDTAGATPHEPVADWRITTNKQQTADEYGILLRELFAMRQIPMDVVDAIIVSSVVPPIDSALRQVCERQFKVKPLFVEPGVKTGLPVLVDSPAEVGADRIVNCVAAFEKYGGPCIVVDLGTATTFDVISARGEFIGGAIAPGLEISADALFEHAAKLPRVDVKRPAKIIGTSTTDNIQIGLFYGYIGMVDGILERMIAELGPQTKLVATGGLARLLAGGSKYVSEVDPMLTMTGLRIVYERNAERGRRRPVAANAAAHS